MKHRRFWLALSILLMATGGLYAFRELYVYFQNPEDLGLSVTAAAKLMTSVWGVMISGLIFYAARRHEE